MNLTSGQRRRHLVACERLVDLSPDELQSRHANWDVTSCTSFDEVSKLIAALRPDAVALPFDAFDEESAANVQAIAANKGDTHPVILLTSSFNPRWMENMAAWAGGNIFLPGEPSLGDVIDAIEAAELRAEV